MSNEITIETKVGQLSDIGQYIKPGCFVAIGGGWSCNKPMAIVREIIRQKIGGEVVKVVSSDWQKARQLVDSIQGLR